MKGIWNLKKQFKQKKGILNTSKCFHRKTKYQGL